MKIKLRILPTAAVLSLLTAACSTTPVTTSEAVERLFDTRRTFVGASSLANVRVTGKGGQTFRASVLVDGSGSVTLSALSPFGTTAAQVRIEQDSITLVNHLRNTYWRGDLGALSGGSALADAFRLEGLGFLLAGLPPWADDDLVRQEIIADDLTRLSNGPLSLIISRTGILSGTLDLGGGEQIAVRFDRPSTPPVRLSVSSSVDPTRIVQFEHLDLDFRPVTLEPIEIPADYRRADSWETVVQ